MKTKINKKKAKNKDQRSNQSPRILALGWKSLDL